METAFVAFGHGYESGSLGRCTAFDGFDVFAEPLGGFSDADRERRVWKGETGPGVTYGSHAIKLATREHDRGAFFILMQHGGGREVLRVQPVFYSAVLDVLKAMDERDQYAFAYTIWDTARNAKVQAEREAAAQWSSAFVEKRIRTKRSGGRVRVTVESAQEKAWRTGQPLTARVEG